MKTTYLNENIALFGQLYETYSKSKEEFLHLTGGEMPALFFAFDTRFTLSANMHVAFDKNSIKSKDARACYVRLFKLSDFWVTYESLLRILYEQGYFTDINAKSTAVKDKEAVDVFELGDIITSCNNQLKYYCLNTERYTSKIRDYFSYLSQNSSATQLALLNKAVYSIKSEKPFSIQEIMAVIYAVHSLFFSKGETSLSRIKNLTLTKLLFEILYDFLNLTSLKIGTRLIQNKISDIAK